MTSRDNIAKSDWSESGNKYHSGKAMLRLLLFDDFPNHDVKYTFNQDDRIWLSIANAQVEYLSAITTIKLSKN